MTKVKQLKSLDLYRLKGPAEFEAEVRKSYKLLCSLWSEFEVEVGEYLDYLCFFPICKEKLKEYVEKEHPETAGEFIERQQKTNICVIAMNMFRLKEVLDIDPSFRNLLRLVLAVIRYLGEDRNRNLI